jgi:hypothetical protein
MSKLNTSLPSKNDFGTGSHREFSMTTDEISV